MVSMSKTQQLVPLDRSVATSVATLIQPSELEKFCVLADQHPDKLCANLPASLPAALPAIIADAAAAVAPADENALRVALTRTLSSGMGGPMPEGEREQWILSLMDDMRDIPGDLALEAIRKARGACTRAAEVYPFIVAYVEDYPARLRRRLQRLVRLAEVAGVDVE